MGFSFIERFRGAHLLVAGEVGIDEYLWGTTRRISPEAPVPVVEVESQTENLGLAANVAQNLASLGARATLVSVRGTDQDGARIEAMVKKAGISGAEFIADPSRPTLRKVRVIAQKQQLVRVDYERSHPLEGKVASSFNDRICDLLPQTDGVILQDYGKGLWNEETVRFVKYAREKKKPVFVDPSRLTPLSLYRGVTLLTPNMVEAEMLCGVPPERHARSYDEKVLAALALKILDVADSDHAVITCGEHGMISASRGETGLSHIPTFAREVFDVTGAGDTVIAVLSLMMVLGNSLTHSMQVANAAAGLVVGHIGTACVTPAELTAELERLVEIGLISK
jgi:D-glycero-beta-D-manno-heptose-7-phosphate kinase